MPAPLVAGAAKVVSTGSKIERRASPSAAKSRVSARSTGREVQRTQRRNRGFAPESDQTAVPGMKIETEQSGASSDHAPSRIRAWVATVTIFWWVWPYYLPQFFFWLLGLAGIGLESMPIPVVRELVSFVVPGQEIFLFSYLLIALIGLGSMTYAAFAYSIRRIRPFEGIRMLAFALCFAGYLTFFLNLFPWVFVWMLMVVYTERKESQVEH